MSVDAGLSHALVSSRGAGSRDNPSNIAARVPRVPRVHAQHIQHIPEVQANRRHPQRHLVRRQLCTQPAGHRMQAMSGLKVCWPLPVMQIPGPRI